MKRIFRSATPAFSVGNIDIFSVCRAKDHRYFHKNGREKHGFLYVVHGKWHADFSSGVSMELSCGDFAFVPAGCVYNGHYLENETEIRIVQFDLSFGELPNYLSAPVKIVLPEAKESIDAFFDLSQNAEQGQFYHLFCMYRLLWQVDRLYSHLPMQYARIQKALVYIEEHLEENTPVAFYAKLCNMSEACLRRLFREYTGKSPIEYRNALRLEVARARLQSGEYNVSEAAESVGFSNLSFFIRLYKKQYNCTPKQG